MQENSVEVLLKRSSCYPHTAHHKWEITDGIEEALKYAQEQSGLHFAS